MEDGRKQIKFLDDHTAASLRGSQVIGSISRAVEELVLNSIQADAKSIRIKLSNNNEEVIVQDDGVGINADAMRRFIGTEYCSTSTGDSDESRNGKGETLRSLVSLCVHMKIESCSCYTEDKNKKRALSTVNGLSSLNYSKGRCIVQSEKIFRNGNVISFNQSNKEDDETVARQVIIPKLDWKSNEHTTGTTVSGTTITLRGLFHQHAVRRKQHYQACQDKATNYSYQLIQTCIRILALSYPHIGFQLFVGGKVDCAYQSNLESNATTLSLRQKSRALISRLHEMYPTEFEDSLELVHEDSRTNFRAFGALCISDEGGSNDIDAPRYRDLEMIAINGRVPAQTAVLADAVLSQVRASRGNRASEYHNCFARCIVIFFPPGSLLCYHVRFLCTLLHSHLIQEL